MTPIRAEIVGDNLARAASPRMAPTRRCATTGRDFCHLRRRFESASVRE
jgi:hypothetical protein